MEQQKIVVDTDRWLDATFKAFETFRETRRGSVSAEEAEFVQSRLRDMWWLAHTSLAALFNHSGRVPYPSWVFANQRDPRTALETFKYLLLSAQGTGGNWGEVPFRIVDCLRPSATDPTGSTTILEAILSYGETDRSSEVTDTLTQEAKVLSSLWVAFAYHWIAESPLERLVIVPSDDTTKLFGFEVVEGQFVRIAVGDQPPRPLGEVFNEQLQLVSSDRFGSLRHFWKWQVASTTMEPAIAHRRVVSPLIALLLLHLCDADSDLEIVGLDKDWLDWTESRDDPAYADLEKALLAGLTEEEAEATRDEWRDALRVSEERNRRRPSCPLGSW